MAKPTGGLMAFDARGQLGKTIVYSSWRGRNYVRRYVVPANPKTTAQTGTRTIFQWLQESWKRAPSGVQESWTAAAKGKPYTNRNWFTKFGAFALISAGNLTTWDYSSAAGGGLAPAAATATGGANQLTIAVTAPALPDGWTIVEAQAACVEGQNPTTQQLWTWTYGTDLTSPYSIVLSGLAATTTYHWCAWFKFQKPDGTFAYGPSIMGDTATT